MIPIILRLLTSEILILRHFTVTPASEIMLIGAGSKLLDWESEF